MLFFELLQVAIGNRTVLSYSPTIGEWKELYVLAQRQAMVGIAYRGVEQLPDGQRPPKALLVQWYMNAERIKVMNADLNGKAIDVANRFLGDGFPNVILKGQGIAKLYRICNENDGESLQPEWQKSMSALSSTLISEYRTPGDIDVWLYGGRKKILTYVRSQVSDCKPVYHHVDFPAIDGLDIEIHFTPSWMNSYFTNRKLQRFFSETIDESRDSKHGIQNPEIEDIPTPSLAFNRVYILVHIYRHLFNEGIGLRQLLDYYFVLTQGFTSEEREETMRVLRSLKMQRFAGAVMWVLQEVYGMDERFLLTTPDEREGRFLLNEIMLAGNFGKYDERLQYKGESSLRWALRKVKRNFRFVRCYPSEVLWSPIFKAWHWVWRKFL